MAQKPPGWPPGRARTKFINIFVWYFSTFVIKHANDDFHETWTCGGASSGAQCKRWTQGTTKYLLLHLHNATTSLHTIQQLRRLYETNYILLYSILERGGAYERKTYPSPWRSLMWSCHSMYTAPHTLKHPPSPGPRLR